MEQHDPIRRPKRSKDPIRAAWEVFQEVIGEKPRQVPRPSKKSPDQKHTGKPESNGNAA